MPAAAVLHHATNTTDPAAHRCSHDLSDHTALVVGARTKLGHQVVLKLLAAGATVVGTTRFPADALHLFRQYREWPEWEGRLHFYPRSLDLDTPHIQRDAAALAAHIEGLAGRLDVLVICAAQTIRWVEGRGQQASAGCHLPGGAAGRGIRPPAPALISGLLGLPALQGAREGAEAADAGCSGRRAEPLRRRALRAGGAGQQLANAA